MEGAVRTVEDAIVLAAEARRSQRYPPPEGEPYVLHPLRLMLRFDDVDRMAAVLHDVVGDRPVSLGALTDAGYPPRLVEAVAALTRRRDETDEAYVEQPSANHVARRVKEADLTENLANNRRRPDAPGNRARIARYEAALRWRREGGTSA